MRRRPHLALALGSAVLLSLTLAPTPTAEARGGHGYSGHHGGHRGSYGHRGGHRGYGHHRGYSHHRSYSHRSTSHYGYGSHYRTRPYSYSHHRSYRVGTPYRGHYRYRYTPRSYYVSAPVVYPPPPGYQQPPAEPAYEPPAEPYRPPATNPNAVGRPSGGGQVYLVIEPADAAVYLDDDFLGTGKALSDLDEPLDLRAGVHALEVLHPSLETERLVFAVPADDDLLVEIDLAGDNRRGHRSRVRTSAEVEARLQILSQLRPSSR